MSKPLHNALGMARFGLVMAAVGIIGEVINVLVRVREPAWQAKLSMVAVWPLSLGFAGFVYSLILPVLAGPGGPTGVAKLFAGTLAGAATTGLFVSPYLFTETSPEMISHSGMLLGALAFGGIAGMFGGLLAPLWRPDTLQRLVATIRGERVNPRAPRPDIEPHSPE